MKKSIAIIYERLITENLRALWEIVRYVRDLVKNAGNYEKKEYKLPKSGREIFFVTTKNHPWYDDVPEKRIIREIESESTRSTVFYDIGAHHGFHSVAAHYSGVSGSSIYAFEADMYNYHVLRKNAAECGINTVKEYVGTGVNGISIDRFTNNAEYPSLVKIDAEGAEGEVIIGMRSTIMRSKPTLLIEIHPTKSKNYRLGTHEIIGWLGRGMEYKLTALHQDGNFEKVNPNAEDFHGLPNVFLKAEKE